MKAETINMAIVLIWRADMPRDKRFTLLGLMIIVLVLGAVAGVVDAPSRGCKTNIDTMNSQIELFYANTGAWPTDLAAVTGSTSYFPDGAPTCPVSGAVYPATLVNNRVDDSGHSH